MTTERLLVVTTRSKLRGVRYLPHMLNATLSIREQLAGADGVVRWASILASPTEFWTVSAWTDRHHMQEFMRSDAHGRWMWRFSDWLSSFWLMRWRPGTRHVGHWDGLRTAPEQGVTVRARPEVPGEVLASMREAVPGLYGALGVDGVAAYECSADARRARRYVAGAGGLIVRVAVAPSRVPGVLRRLHRIRGALDADPRLAGCAVGVGRANEAFLLGVWRDRQGVADALASGWLERARERHGDRLWAGEWLPESEFGHWDGRRLRRDRTLARPQLDTR